MRNLKKILALVLALMMVVSVMVVASAASFNDYDDVDEIDSDYAEAVEVLTNMGVFRGFDGGFQPDTKVTRAEVATLVYRVLTADVTDKNVGLYEDYNYFTDVNENNWFAGYVNYAANGKYVVGVGEDRYDPQGNVTGYQLLVIMLRAIGYGKNSEFEGTSQWTINAATTAEQLGITDGLKTNLNKELTREEVAYILFNAIQVDKVEYTSAFGYQNKPNETTIGYDEFGLEKTTGEISAVGRTAGTTTLVDHSTAANGTELDPVTVTGTNTPWTDIGYGAYVYTVATPGAKTRAAVSDLVITGESLKVTTDGTEYSAKVEVEDDARVYFNGEYQGSLTISRWGRPLENTKLLNNLEAWSDLRGVKVDYIDNDNGGRAEVVVVTEYTTAEISGVTTDTTTSGTSATNLSTVYYTTFQNGKADAVKGIKTANVVAADALVVGDVVTYVDYQGLDTESSRYTYESAGVVANLEKIARDKESNEYYVLGGNELYVSDITELDVSMLAVSKLGASVLYYLDEYGYIIKAVENVSPAQYAFGVSNSHTDGNTKQASGYVVYADGSVSNIGIASVKQQNGNTYSNLWNNAIEKTMHTYSVRPNGTYDLVWSPTAITSVDHAAGNTNITLNGTKYYVNNQTVVVDVTDVLYKGATSATVYTGTANIPAMDHAEGYFVNVGNYVSLMFVYDYGTYATDRFFVYDISTNSVTAAPGGNIYTLSVVRNGVLGTVDLTRNEFYNVVARYGVGIYELDDETLTTIDSYTSYAEVYGDLTWNNDTVTFTAKDGKWDSWRYTADTTITVLDIVDHEAWSFTGLTAGYTHDYLSNTNAKGFVEATGNVANHIYFVIGEEATATNNHHVVDETSDITEAGKIFYVKDGMVTGVEIKDAKAVTVTVDGTPVYGLKAGDSYKLPDSNTENVGTGVKVTVNGGTPSYVEYGETIEITANTTIETGYVCFTVDGTEYPVEYTDNKGTELALAAYLGANASKYTGTYWLQENVPGATITFSKMMDADSDTTQANVDKIITTGYYKVTLNNDFKGKVELTAGKLYNADGTVAYEAGDEITKTGWEKVYYAQKDTTVTVWAADKTWDKAYTVKSADLAISYNTNP